MNPFIAAIKPTLDEEKRVKAVTVSFLKKLNANLTDATAILGGSGAKGTWLSGNHDLDIFVLFPLRKYASRSGELSDIIGPVLQKLFPQQQLKRVHGSRDYFQLMYEGFNIEVVPILKIARAEQAVNITDVSPLHTKWVSAKSAAIKDEILLAKQFCKAQSLYGAESYITGFSGYVLEILVNNSKISDLANEIFVEIWNSPAFVLHLELLGLRTLTSVVFSNIPQIFLL